VALGLNPYPIDLEVLFDKDGREKSHPMSFALLFIFFILVFVVGGSVLWIWMIIDCAMNEPAEGNEKIVWILVIVFAHVLGALIYLLVRRPERIRQYGK
jgi:hypothetical protein